MGYVRSRWAVLGLDRWEPEVGCSYPKVKMGYVQVNMGYVKSKWVTLGQKGLIEVKMGFVCLIGHVRFR